jgi:hypothetical protein
MERPQFLAGDIILFSGQGDLYSKFSRWLMRGDREGPTYAVHTAQFLSSGRVLEMDVVGKLKTVDDIFNKRVKMDTWKRRGFEVWRCTVLSDSQRQAVTHQAVAYLNMRFGFLKFGEHLVDGLLSKLVHKDIFFLRRLHNGYPVCSEITAMAYDRALGYRFGVPPECADPDHIYDWVAGHPDQWMRVFALEEYPT